MSEDPVTHTYGHCDGCGQPLLWGGMSWVPHTVTRHRHTRRLLLTAVRNQLTARMAGKTGHRVTIRFTSEVAWTECLGCDWVGAWVPHSGLARVAGRVHLTEVGRHLLRTRDDGHEEGSDGD